MRKFDPARIVLGCAVAGVIGIVGVAALTQDSGQLAATDAPYEVASVGTPHGAFFSVADVHNARVDCAWDAFAAQCESLTGSGVWQINEAGDEWVQVVTDVGTPTDQTPIGHTFSVVDPVTGAESPCYFAGWHNLEARCETDRGVRVQQADELSDFEWVGLQVSDEGGPTGYTVEGETVFLVGHPDERDCLATGSGRDAGCHDRRDNGDWTWTGSTWEADA